MSHLQCSCEASDGEGGVEEVLEEGGECPGPQLEWKRGCEKHLQNMNQEHTWLERWPWVWEWANTHQFTEGRAHKVPMLHLSATCLLATSCLFSYMCICSVAKMPPLSIRQQITWLGASEQQGCDLIQNIKQEDLDANIQIFQQQAPTLLQCLVIPRVYKLLVILVVIKT